MLFGALLLAAVSFGDAKIVSHVKLNLMNKPTERDTTTYFKGNFMRLETAENATIYNVVTKDTIFLDIPNKTYYESLGAAIQPSTAGMKVEAMAEVKPTDEKSKIAGYDCSKYLADVAISMSPESGNFTAKTQMHMEFWTTAQLKTPYTPDHMLYIVTQMFRGAMNLQGMEKFAKEMSKVQGFPLNNQMTLTIEGLPGMTPPKIQIDQEVISVSEAKLPDSLFQVPADYKKGERAKKPRNGGNS
jgi:hypothetical protein